MIFAEMKQKSIKEAFLTRKADAVSSDPEELKFMSEYLMSDRFDQDMDRLMAGDYFFDTPTLIYLRKGQSNRRRKVYSFSPENKAILRYLAYMMMERYDDLFPDCLYSFRRKRSIRQLYSQIREIDPNREMYVVKADIHSFGESIDPMVLDEMLRTWLSDEPEVYSFIMWLITRNRYIRNGKEEEGFTSVLPGNPLVPFLQNIFLQDVDRFMQENSIICSRYTDDICMICKDRETAERNMTKLLEMIHEFRLEANEEKTEIIPPGKDYDLLGIKYAPGFRDISDNTFIKACTRIKHRSDRLHRKIREGVLSNEEAVRRMAFFINRYFYGNTEKDAISFIEHFFPYITSAERLRRLDHLCQDCLRVLAIGRHTNAKYRFRYSEIRKLGYVPLVHAYYTRNTQV